MGISSYNGSERGVQSWPNVSEGTVVMPFGAGRVICQVWAFVVHANWGVVTGKFLRAMFCNALCAVLVV